MRLTRDPFWLNARLASGQWLYRISHAVIFGLLSCRARRVLLRNQIGHTDAVFGLLQNAQSGRRLCGQTPAALAAGRFGALLPSVNGPLKHELDALINPNIRRLPQELGIRLIRYQDL